MLGKVPASRMRLIEAIVRAARRQLGGRERAVRTSFLRRYYRGVADEDLVARDVADLAGAALAHYAGGRARGGRPWVRVFNPEPGRDGFRCPHTVVMIACDDAPFLVDSMGMAINQAGLAVHLIVHPVIEVVRDRAGRLAAIAEPGTHGARAESWQLLEIDRETDTGRLAALEKHILSALDDVRVAVADWGKMRARAQELASRIATDPPPLQSSELLEGRALLEWMIDNHFTFLGVRFYRLTRGSRTDHLVPDLGSGLGLLRRGRPGHSPHTVRLAGDVRQRARRRSLLVITKANTVSTVHRATYLDYVGVKTFDARGEVSGEYRFLGLWTSTAYSSSPRDIPVLRHKVQEIITHFGLAPQSHDGKAVLHVLEAYPRDELFQATTDELIPTIRGIVNLYDRQVVRLFVRRDTYNRFWSCLLYVPRDRYNTEVRHRIERIARDAFAGTDVESQVQLSESVLARVHLIVRTPEGAVASGALPPRC